MTRYQSEGQGEVVSVTRSYNNSRFCGDQLLIDDADERLLLCLVDGLGHGERAAVAAEAAIAFVSERADELELGELFEGCNSAIRSTRGVAMEVAIIDRSAASFTYAGVGNTRAALVYRDEVRALTGTPGIVGAGFDQLVVESLSLRPRELIAMYTDGLPPDLGLTSYWPVHGSGLASLAEQLVSSLYDGGDDAALLLCLPRLQGGGGRERSDR